MQKPIVFTKHAWEQWNKRVYGYSEIDSVEKAAEHIANSWGKRKLVKQWVMHQKHPQYDVGGIRVAVLEKPKSIMVITVLGDVKTANWSYKEHIRNLGYIPRSKKKYLKNASNF
ncbi:MAG: hypothetical protein HPY90_05695 [Syntrophothermus sp.]|uniref:hypothetical protein n=1 Tax=Syntrophothermus sp. TaxID=2736299 RepID=UPI002579BDCE|nr:hypothetical protein [Syntrophothermus sp.]NSW82758.1 hypothetical protein [Syntrophothermus sp.]